MKNYLKIALYSLLASIMFASVVLNLAVFWPKRQANTLPEVTTPVNTTTAGVKYIKADISEEFATDASLTDPTVEFAYPYLKTIAYLMNNALDSRGYTIELVTNEIVVDGDSFTLTTESMEGGRVDQVIISASYTEGEKGMLSLSNPQVIKREIEYENIINDTVMPSHERDYFLNGITFEMTEDENYIICRYLGNFAVVYVKEGYAPESLQFVTTARTNARGVLDCGCEVNDLVNFLQDVLFIFHDADSIYYRDILNERSILTISGYEVYPDETPDNSTDNYLKPGVYDIVWSVDLNDTETISATDDTTFIFEDLYVPQGSSDVCDGLYYYNAEDGEYNYIDEPTLWIGITKEEFVECVKTIYGEIYIPVPSVDGSEYEYIPVTADMITVFDSSWYMREYIYCEIAYDSKTIGEDGESLEDITYYYTGGFGTIDYLHGRSFEYANHYLFTTTNCTEYQEFIVVPKGKEIYESLRGSQISLYLGYNMYNENEEAECEIIALSDALRYNRLVIYDTDTSEEGFTTCKMKYLGKFGCYTFNVLLLVVPEDAVIGYEFVVNGASYGNYFSNSYRGRNNSSNYATIASQLNNLQIEVYEKYADGSLSSEPVDLIDFNDHIAKVAEITSTDFSTSSGRYYYSKNEYYYGPDGSPGYQRDYEIQVGDKAFTITWIGNIHVHVTKGSN